VRTMSGPDLRLAHLRFQMMIREGGPACFANPDQRTTWRCIHFMPNGKRATVESIPFEF